MNDVAAGPGRRHDLTAPLTRLTEAASVVLDLSTASGRALFTALADCCRSLGAVSVYEEPYRSDPRTTLENFERVRTALQWVLYEVAAPAEGKSDDRPGVTPDPPAPQERDEEPDVEQDEEPDGEPDGDPYEESDEASAVEQEDAEQEDAEQEDAEQKRDPAPFSASADPPRDPRQDLVDALTVLEGELWREQARHLGKPPAKRRPAGAARPPAEQIAELWRRFHLALLRLPADARRTWRGRAGRTAADAGFAVGQRDSDNPDAVIPALPDGLCDPLLLPLDLADPAGAAARAAPDILRELALTPEETLALDPGDPRLEWAARADQALRLVELDPDLRVALVHDEQPGGLARREARETYRAALLGHLRSAGQGLQEEGWTPDHRLGAAHELDMVLGGLVHARPAAPDSWWYEWRTRVSRLLVPLAREARYEVIVQRLDELRRDALKDCTVAGTVKGVPGAGELEVQWVVWTPLRPYGNLGDNRHRGRLVVRPVDPPSRG